MGREPKRFSRLSRKIVPIEHNGKPATVNFWSGEKDAFPPEAVKLLEEVARAME